MRKQITITQTACAYEPEQFLTSFGFKGNNTRAQTGAVMMNFNNNL